MALTLGDNFSYQGAKPLDARVSYDTIAEMKAKADSTLYDGIIAFCKADGKNYQWKSTNPVDETLGKWREFTTGSGGASSLADLSDVDVTGAADGDVLKYDETEEKWVKGQDTAGEGRAKSEVIALIFDDSTAYSVGDKVMYEDELYICTTAHEGEWDSADFDKTDVAEITNPMPSTDMPEVISPLPSVQPRRMKYSTEEQIVGKWIDGKPIYQLTGVINNPVINSRNHITALEGIVDSLISINAIGEVEDGASINSFWSSANTFFQYTLGGDSESLYISAAGYYIPVKVFFTIQYTKTTD